MNKVIIVGHLCSAYEEVEELLRMCGMVHANQSIREGFTPQQITATLCKAHGITKYYENISQIDIGAVWHGMVLDLMLANIEQSFWGWSDPNVIYLLNFWKSIDPKIAFILVYDKPESVFTRHEITASSEQNHTKEMLNAWSAYNLELLDFYRKNSDRCLLVHAQQVRLSAASYIQQLKIRINKNFKFPNKLLWKGTEISCLEESPKRGTKSKKIAKQSEEIAQYQQTVETTAILSCNPNDNALSRYIAKALAHNDRQSAKVYKELQESANLPLINEGVEGVAAADAWQAMMDQIYKSQTQTKQIQNLTEQLSRAEQNAQNTVHSLELEINKAKAEYEEVKNRAEALKHEQSKQLEKLNEQSKKTEDIEKQKAALSQNLQQTEKLAKERAEQL
ncbi:MAG: hypothetical protein LBP40_03645, partial [Campylobacteraceae bacterium]|nr:hypothetical protein [Campylobacteraceae bacterium]